MHIENSSVLNDIISFLIDLASKIKGFIEEDLSHTHVHF